MSETMRAVVLDGPGPPEALVLKVVPIPEVRPGLVLIEVKAFAESEHAEEGFGDPVELIQRTPSVCPDGRCDLSVVRTRIGSFRRAIRLNMPDGVR